MTPEEIVSRAESGDLRPLRLHAGTAGVSEAFFQRIARLLSSDPAAAVGLGRKWKSFARHGDSTAYVWRGKAAALRAEGKWKLSGISFREAGARANNALDECVFQLGAIDSLARAGQTRQAIELGRGLVDRLVGMGAVEFANRARLNLANALIWTDQYDLARAEYQAVLDASSDLYERASAHLGLSTSLLHGGNPAMAEEHARTAARNFSELEFGFFEALAEINLAHADLLRGRPEDAWMLLSAVRDRVSESPPDVARVQEFLGDTYLELGLFEESAASYELALSGNASMPLNQANSWFGLGQTMAALNSTDEAIAAFERAKKIYRRARNRVWELVAQVEIDNLRQDAWALLVSSSVLSSLGAVYAGTRAALLAAHWGETYRLETATRDVETLGFTGLRWRALWAHARTSGDRADYRKMVDSILDQRLLTRSTSARLTFLRDKNSAMREMFNLLLADGTAESRAELLDLLRKTRAAALIDELLANPSSESLRGELDALRSEISQGETDEPGGVRRVTAAAETRMVSSVALRDIRIFAEQTVATLTADATWLDLGDRWACLSVDAANILPCERIKSTLRWLLFEMMAPLVDRNADPTSCLALVEDLKREFDWARGQIICPDGFLWQVPWALLGDGEPTVVMNPAGHDPRYERLPADAKVAIWYQESAGLPQIRAEVDTLLSHFPNAKLCASAASVRELLASGDHYDLVHVATHAHFTASNAMFSHFAFEDGVVHAFEIAHSSFRVTAAVLAACNTGQMSPTIPDEPNGFARAFLARGARSVTAGLWPLDDGAALILMKTLYMHLNRGSDWESSLAAARQACQNELPHPYFWGGIMLYGGPAHA